MKVAVWSLVNSDTSSLPNLENSDDYFKRPLFFPPFLFDLIFWIICEGSFGPDLWDFLPKDWSIGFKNLRSRLDFLIDFLRGMSLGSFWEFNFLSLSLARILTLDLSSKALASLLCCSVSGFFSSSWSRESRKSRWNSVLASESLSSC